MIERITRRRALLLGAVALAGLAAAPAPAQDTHGGGPSGGAGGGHVPGGGHVTGDSHDEGSHTDSSHEDGSHDDGGHTDGSHEEGGHTGHEPGETEDETHTKLGPRYRGGRSSSHLLGRGYGRSLEDRVLKGH